MARKTSPLKKVPQTADEEMRMVRAGEYTPNGKRYACPKGESGWDFVMRMVHNPPKR